ncbi:phosphomannomutase/phosphoglucomutase [Corynebacterium sp. 320]|uniref:phosphomannomutase/phosphoglucomutase n=1 Tax=Corynebacterium TaxID=1716 RepID=UPI00125CB5C0|nr:MULTISPECIES: phosphomannomutase/phosphoglucomutase [Corynebacterium]KAB1504175.1 phosphomannomutase/phosphoglucomutase [Corynebacterium sp. 320]KAB1552725.1 phosphomannomutase/phosphoglucomutase [Corynebacterium sp. 321]KAB1554057.1 phosphomannomutase/phosphoglucomutase [Corynebacterium sp. 319]KAB3528311.1 phosphomannomutase/phosphoglucomutase [Corynebacterium sp. 250]KAB3540200.1 phosphomannomutase/phosphoglucomutase [Corynebacterium sp. 366]
MTTYKQQDLDAMIKAYDVRGVVGEGPGQIGTEFTRAVGASFGRLMREEGADTVVIGHDMRDSSPGLSAAFAEGVNSQGVDTITLGLTSTDELYYASGVKNCPGAMFTASHNPAKYNGIKLCRAGARPVGQDSGLNTIKADLQDGIEDYQGEPGHNSEEDVLQGYADYLTDLVPLDIRPLKVAVDAGNGMGGLTVPAVFEGQPLDLHSLYFELDGNFPNHEANPLDPNNLVDLQKYTVEVGADLGIAFDGDADRCFIVDEKGEAVSPSTVCAIIAERYLKNNPGATIIHNLITSKSVPELVTKMGGQPVRTRVGHSFIKATMAETNAIFGGEHSAHYYFSDFFNADSGMIAALHLLATLGGQDKPLSELKKAYELYQASGEINSEVSDQAGRTEAVVEAFADRTESVDRLDGVTIELKDGSWMNVRASNTEPLLRLNIEAPTQAEVDALVDEALAIIRA